jgi:hypothetical protein
METIEEASREYESTFGMGASGTESVDFTAGAKWQEKRMYSEEEVLDIFFKFFCHQIDEDVENKLSFQQFIKQFKK